MDGDKCWGKIRERVRLKKKTLVRRLGAWKRGRVTCQVPDWMAQGPSAGVTHKVRRPSDGRERGIVTFKDKVPRTL